MGRFGPIRVSRSGLGEHKVIVTFIVYYFMAVKQQISANDGTYFITITCFKWLHLFEITNGYDCVYKWFNSLQKNGHYINGYVIMPDHLHALKSYSNTGKDINTISWKRETFYGI
ncbi:hypothetical protein BH20BAC1_BH20BAC1_01060 [soil metagenome]